MSQKQENGVKRRQGLFGSMAATGFVLGLLAVQLVPTRIVPPEEPAWRKFGRVASAEPDPYYSYVDFLPDFSRMPVRLPSWTEPPPALVPEPVPEPVPDLVTTEGIWREVPAEAPMLDDPPPIPVLARTGPREIRIVTGAVSPEPAEEPPLTDVEPLPEESSQDAYGG